MLLLLLFLIRSRFIDEYVTGTKRTPPVVPGDLRFEITNPMIPSSPVKNSGCLRST